MSCDSNALGETTGVKRQYLHFLAPCLLVSSLNISNLKAEENPENKVVEQVLVEGKVLEISDFYIGDMGVAAYETHEAKDFKACSEILLKIAGFSASEARLSRKPEAAAMLDNSAASLNQLAARLLTDKPPSLDEIEPPLAQIDQGLELSYGSSVNKAMKKKIDAAPVEVVTAHLYSFTLRDVFAQVRTDWTEGRNIMAAEKVEKAVAFMKSEIVISRNEEGRAALMTATDKLDKLKDRISDKEVKDGAELDVVFALSHNALAQDYESRSLIATFSGRKARLKEEAAEQKAAAEVLMKK